MRRPVRVATVRRSGPGFVVETNTGTWPVRAVVCITGSWSNPFVPVYSGQDNFSGVQLHSAYYRKAASFAGQRVLVVGSGNSGAQLLAEVSRVAHTTQVTEKSLVSYRMTWMAGGFLQRYHAQGSKASAPPHRSATWCWWTR